MRLSGIVRTDSGDRGSEPIPLRRIVLWSAVGLAVVAGLVLYFRHARQLVPLLG